MPFVLVLMSPAYLPSYVLTAATEGDKYTAITAWLATNNIGTATSGEYSSPDSLAAMCNYCVLGSGLFGVFRLFTVISTPDWEGDPPAPQYSTLTGYLSWMETA